MAGRLTVTALEGSGAFLRYRLGGESTRLLAWLGGVLFIPSLALAMGLLALTAFIRQWQLTGGKLSK